MLERSSIAFRDPANSGRTLIPLLLESCSLPAFINCIQHVDFRDGADFAFNELLSVCRPNVKVPAFPIARTSKNVLPQSSLVTFKARFSGHSGKVSCVTFSPDGKWLLSGSQDGTIRLWELQTGYCHATLVGHIGGVSSVLFSPDGNRILSGSLDSSARVWQVESGIMICMLKGHKTGVNGVASLNNEGSQILTCSSHTMDSLKVWDVESSKCLKTIDGHKGSVTAIAVRKDGKEALTASYDRTLRLWDLSSGECVASFEGHGAAVRSVKISVDGRYAVSGGDDKLVKLWNLETRNCLQTMEGHNQKVYSVAISPHGTLIASAGFNDHTTRLWDRNSGKCLHVIEHVELPSPMSVSFSLDGKRLAVGASKTNSIYIYDLEQA